MMLLFQSSAVIFGWGVGIAIAEDPATGTMIAFVGAILAVISRPFALGLEDRDE